MSDYLDTAIDASKKAGKVLMRYYSKEIKFEKKADKSFVSEADLAAEKIILDIILKKFPMHSFYSEEAGKSKNKSEYCWYIDPLDGTHNFLHGIPFFGTSIALAKGNEFIVGVIYLPFTNELFYAEKGKGAYLNNKKISVSKNKLSSSVGIIPGTIVYNKGKISKLAKIFENYCQDLRIIGSVALSISYIACGRFDFNIKPNITPYDVGAGLVILEEAGGKLTKLDGSKFLPEMEQYNFIASNNVFHDKLIKIMEEEFK